jgi:hypothetical protein
VARSQIAQAVQVSAAGLEQQAREIRVAVLTSVAEPIASAAAMSQGAARAIEARLAGAPGDLMDPAHGAIVAAGPPASGPAAEALELAEEDPAAAGVAGSEKVNPRRMK